MPTRTREGRLSSAKKKQVFHLPFAERCRQAFRNLHRSVHSRRLGGVCWDLKGGLQRLRSCAAMGDLTAGRVLLEQESSIRLEPKIRHIAETELTNKSIGQSSRTPFMVAARMQAAAAAAGLLVLLLLVQANAEADVWRSLQVDPAIPFLAFLNPNLRAAYVALQAWKAAITSDPSGITGTWVGYDVCKYKGVFCAPPPDASCNLVVAGIDLNHANIAGTLPEKLGLLTYLALFHINTNRFSGTLPISIVHWTFLYELDISNNLFSGPFPFVALALPSLAFLDVRYNSFSGQLPADLFAKHLDAIFVNGNEFSGSIPANLGRSPASVVVFGRNHFIGGIPSSIGDMFSTLNEIIFLGNSIDGCVPDTVGALPHLTVFDISYNSLSGGLPVSISDMVSLQQLDVAHNMLSGPIPSLACGLSSMQNFTASFNFFTEEDATCVTLPSFEDSRNCIPGRPDQRSPQECSAFFGTEQLCPRPVSSQPPVQPVFAPPVHHQTSGQDGQNAPSYPASPYSASPP